MFLVSNQAPIPTIKIPENRLNHGTISSGANPCATSMTTPSAMTLKVCVKVTTSPRNTASITRPLEPTRYAATMAFPCPGVKACSPPNTNETTRATTASWIVSGWFINSFIRSPECSCPSSAKANVHTITPIQIKLACNMRLQAAPLK